MFTYKKPSYKIFALDPKFYCAGLCISTDTLK